MGPLSSFVGRDEDGERLRRLVADRRLVTVVGPGGIGKTRLANEYVAQAPGVFPGGVHHCELAPVSSRGDIGAEVAGQLGFPAVEALLLGLGDAHALAVLDNCEHVLRAASRLCQLLLTRCPRLHVLATSREPLGLDGEQVFVLGPLALPNAGDALEHVAAAAAVLLFADRARATGARFDGTPEQLRAAGELCRRLDGLPLAIELAASRSRSLTPAELLGHLDRRFELLRRTEPIGGARHGCLRAAIEASCALLDAGEHAFFRALGVFAGPFDARLVRLPSRGARQVGADDPAPVAAYPASLGHGEDSRTTRRVARRRQALPSSEAHVARIPTPPIGLMPRGGPHRHVQGTRSAWGSVTTVPSIARR